MPELHARGGLKPRGNPSKARSPDFAALNPGYAPRPPALRREPLELGLGVGELDEILGAGVGRGRQRFDRGGDSKD